MKKVSFYYGWKIIYRPSNPVTGRFMAVKHGITMCADSQATLIDMIDRRRKDPNSWPNKNLGSVPVCGL